MSNHDFKNFTQLLTSPSGALKWLSRYHSGPQPSLVSGHSMPPPMAIKVIIYFEQVVKVIWHKAATLLNTDGSVIFARSHQCALACNICFLGSTQVHIPNGSLVLHSSQHRVPILVRQCAAHFPSKMPLCMGDLDPSNTLCLSPPESRTQTASRLVQPFLQGSQPWHIDRPSYLSATIGIIHVALRCSLKIII